MTGKWYILQAFFFLPNHPRITFFSLSWFNINDRIKTLAEAVKFVESSSHELICFVDLYAKFPSHELICLGKISATISLDEQRQ